MAGGYFILQVKSPVVLLLSQLQIQYYTPLSAGMLSYINVSALSHAALKDKFHRIIMYVSQATAQAHLNQLLIILQQHENEDETN